MVMSPLGFKIRVGSALMSFLRESYVIYIPWDPPLVLHLPTSWQPVFTSAHASDPGGSWPGFKQEITRTEDEPFKMLTNLKYWWDGNEEENTYTFHRTLRCKSTYKSRYRFHSPRYPHCSKSCLYNLKKKLSIVYGVWLEVSMIHSYFWDPNFSDVYTPHRLLKHFPGHPEQGSPVLNGSCKIGLACGHVVTHVDSVAFSAAIWTVGKSTSDSARWILHYLHIN